jgi:hypothetical protein
MFLHFYANGKINCKINVRENSAKGKLLGSYNLIHSGKLKEKTVSFDLKNTKGDKNIYLQFEGETGLLKLDWFSFRN